MYSSNVLLARQFEEQKSSYCDGIVCVCVG